MISLDAGSEATFLLNEPFNELNPVLSPDGNWMAYESDESGRFEIYVRPFPNVDDDLIQVSSAGGVTPLWSRDGRELFYLEPSDPLGLMAVLVESEGIDFAVGTKTRLIDWPYVGGGTQALRKYDVSPDGARFLGIAMSDVGDVTRPRIVMVQNWFTEIERLVPVP